MGGIPKSAMARGHLRSRVISVAAACLIAASVLLATPSTSNADSATRRGSLPVQTGFAASAWDGRNYYVIGGLSPTGGAHNRIWRYRQDTNSVTEMAAKLPRGTAAAASIWNGSYIYIFGGKSDYWGAHNNEIHRYDPATDTIEKMSAVLPPTTAATGSTGRSGASGVWTGSVFYIFGGNDQSANGMRDIVKYDPASDTATRLNAQLPTGRWGTAAFWDGRYAYIVGGQDHDEMFDSILRFDPTTEEVAGMQSRLPQKLAGSAVVWTGEHALIIGGYYSEYSYQYVEYFYGSILTFDPVQDLLSYMSATLPARAGYAASFDGHFVHVFGGYWSVTQSCGTYCYQTTFYYSNDIYRYDITPGPPNFVRALPGPGLGDITVSWDPPNYATFTSPISSYRIYRTVIGVESRRLIGEVETTYAVTFVDSTCRAGQVCYYEVTAVNRFGESAARGGWTAYATGWST